MIRLPGRTPVIFFEVPATKTDCRETVVLYGHLDKQPEFNGWRGDLGPWTPSSKTAASTARGCRRRLRHLCRHHRPARARRPGRAAPALRGPDRNLRGERGFDLPAYLDVLKPRLGEVSLVVCLDSGAGDYDRLWLTTSLRGMVSACSRSRC